MTTVKKTHWLRTTLAVLIICGILGTILSAILFSKDPGETYATANLQFSFDGAAEGMAPNGAMFNLSDIASEEVLTAALESAGLKEKYTAEQIQPSLIAKGVYPENLKDQVMQYDSLMDFTANRTLTVGDYHPTQFSVTLNNDFDAKVSEADLKNLLSAILTCYQAHFAKTYALGTDASEYNNLFDLTLFDYPQQMEVIRQGLTFASEYAAELYEQEPTFRLNGTGFNDIAVRLNTLIDNDIARINANITMNALTKDTARLLTEYQYEIKDLNNQLTNQKQNLEKLDTLIAAYDKNEIIYVSTADSLTKIDGNSSETYDSLVASRKEVADGITALNSEIATCQLKIDDLLQIDKTEAEPEKIQPEQTADGETDGEAETVTEPAPAMTEEEIEAVAKEAEEKSAAQITALEASISDLLSRREEIFTEFTGLVNAYNAQEINADTVRVSEVKYKTPRLISSAFIVRTIKTAGPFCAIGFIVCMILLIKDRKKENKA